MNNLVEEVQRLQEIERRYNNIQDKLSEVGDFINDWDSGDPDRLPTNKAAQINPIRYFYTFVKC